MTTSTTLGSSDDSAIDCAGNGNTLVPQQRIIRSRKRSRSGNSSRKNGAALFAPAAGPPGTKDGQKKRKVVDKGTIYESVAWDTSTSSSELQPHFIPQPGAIIVTADAPRLRLPKPRYRKVLASPEREVDIPRCDSESRGTAAATGSSSSVAIKSLQYLTEEVLAALQTRGVVTKEDIVQVTGASGGDVDDVLEALLCTPLVSVVFMEGSSNGCASKGSKPRRRPGRTAFAWCGGTHRLPVPVGLRTLHAKLRDSGERLFPLVTRVEALEAAVRELEGIHSDTSELVANKVWDAAKVKSVLQSAWKRGEGSARQPNKDKEERGAGLENASGNEVHVDGSKQLFDEALSVLE